MVKSFKESPICQKFKHKNKDKIMAFLDLMFSQKSELNHIQNFGERIAEACGRAKLSQDDQDVQDIIQMKNEEVNDLIFAYRISQNTNQYNQLLSEQILLWNIQKILSKPLDDAKDVEKEIKSRSSMSEDADRLIERIERRYDVIWNFNEVKGMATGRVVSIISLEQRLKEKAS